MNYFVIIRGPLGVGKSTVAKLLAKRLNAVYISLDELLEQHGLDKTGPNDKCVPAENFIRADEIILPEVKQMLAQGKSVIFDACFYHRNHIRHLIENLPYPYRAFTLKAPLKVCIERDSGRKKIHGKGAATAVHSLVSRFDYGTVINTEMQTVGQTLHEIAAHLHEG